MQKHKLKNYNACLFIFRKLELKDRISEDQELRIFIEEEKEKNEGADSSDESFQSPVLDKESYEDVILQVDKSYADNEKVNMLWIFYQNGVKLKKKEEKRSKKL